MNRNQHCIEIQFDDMKAQIVDKRVVALSIPDSDDSYKVALHSLEVVKLSERLSRAADEIQDKDSF